MLIFFLGQKSVFANSEGDFIFEGLVETSAPELAPVIRSGQVFAGSFNLNSSNEVRFSQPSHGMARYENSFTSVEFTLDINYLIATSGRWRDGHNWIELTPGSALTQSDDFLAMLLPLTGELIGSTGWRANWLELWFYHDPSKMLSGTRMPDLDLNYRQAWFRITYFNESTTTNVLVEGPLTAYGPAGSQLSPAEQVAMWQQAVVDLNQRLAKAESEREQLRLDLELARERIRGLHQTVDFLVSEKTTLQREIDQLRLTAPEADSELAELQAEWEAYQAMLESANEQLRVTNLGLAEALVHAEREGRTLRHQLGVLNERLQGIEPLPLRSDGLLEAGTFILEEQPLETRVRNVATSANQQPPAGPVAPLPPQLGNAFEDPISATRAAHTRIGSRRR